MTVPVSVIVLLIGLDNHVSLNMVDNYVKYVYLIVV